MNAASPVRDSPAEGPREGVVRKRTVTTIEVQQIVIIRRPRAAAHALCPVCLKEVEMVGPEEAAALMRISVRSVYARIETGSVHFMETADGLLLLCASSLVERNPDGKHEEISKGNFEINEKQKGEIDHEN